MSELRLCFDRAILGDKIIEETDESLVMESVIASEIVHKYEDGWAYKPAAELEKSVDIIVNRLGDIRPVVIMQHPPNGWINQGDLIYGRTEQHRFVKDLLDPKTKRPMRRGIRANIRWYKDRVPEETIERIKSGDLRDVSIGFAFQKDETAGEHNGQTYDYVQRSIFIDHTAAPVGSGRCPTPYCGIGADQVTPLVIGLDPWEETEENIRSGHRDPGQFHAESLRTITISESEGIKAVIGCPRSESYEGGRCAGGTEVQSYLFSKEKGWTEEKAKAWFSEHEGDTLAFLEGSSGIESHWIMIKGDPFAEYESFEDCVNKNQDKDNPEGYCREIQERTEGGDCPICDFIADLSARLDAEISQDLQLVINRLSALMVRELGADTVLALLEKAQALNVLASLDSDEKSHPHDESDSGQDQESLISVDEGEKIFQLWKELHSQHK